MRIFFCIIGYLLLVPLFAQEESLSLIEQQFRKGNYQDVVTLLKPDGLPTPSNQYLLGLSYSRLQEYDKANIAFRSALRNGFKSEDFFYEYGQSLFAENKLQEARLAFVKSAKQHFREANCYYYIAHISQILEEYDYAKEFFLAAKDQDYSDAKTKQIALFQLAEVELIMAKDKNLQMLDLFVEKKVLPYLKEAYAIDEKSQVGRDINKRISELLMEFNLDPNMLLNGRRISPKKYLAYASQKIKYDTNVTQVNENNNVTGSAKTSLVFESELFGKYDFIYQKKIVVSPELRFNFTKYGNQTDSDVYQNDSLGLYASLRNKYEHRFFDKPSSFLLDFEYSNTLKDWQASHKLLSYAHSFALSVGESLPVFSFGDTTLKIKRKSYNGSNSLISNTTISIAADQTAYLPGQKILIGYFEYNKINNYNNTLINSNSLIFRLDFLILEIAPGYTLGTAMMLTMTNPINQKDIRGIEKTLTPSIDLTKKISANLSTTINLEYTKATSLLPDYEYSKVVLTGGLKYSF